MSKSFQISKQAVWNAYLQVKQRKGGPGHDRQTMGEFERDLKNNLYKIWNRMSAGSYLPPPVLQVEIPKPDGGTRTLGIPTVSDRIAQTVVRNELERICEPQFHEDSYGYRPNKSAHDAVSKARQRCWRDDYVLDLDIKGYFDSIDHDLMMKAVEWFAPSAWALLYIRRWLTADGIMENGKLVPRAKGTPQGGVISPLLSNIFLHFVFDKWMERNFPHIHFERYADDIVVHCRSKNQLEMIHQKIESRLADCHLELNSKKTKAVYCRDSNRKEKWVGPIDFEFLGFRFMPRLVRKGSGQFFVSYCPAISDRAAKNIRQIIKKKWRLGLRTHVGLEDLAKAINATVRGWVSYYGRFHGSALYSKIFLYLNQTLMRWAMRKFKPMNCRPYRASEWLKRSQRMYPRLFYHWTYSTGH